MRLAAAAIVLLVLSCASVPNCPDRADEYAEHVQGRTTDPFWFTNAIIQTSYHVASIAPYQILDDTEQVYFADRLTMTERMCASDRAILGLLRRARFVKVTAHGHFDDSATTLIIDCICSAEPVPETPDLGSRMEPLFPR